MDILGSELKGPRVRASKFHVLIPEKGFQYENFIWNRVIHF